MTEEIERIIEYTAKRVAIECFRNEPEVKTLTEKREKEHRIYEARKEIVKPLFERYRVSEPEDGIRKVVDSLITLHRDCPETDYLYKKRHNLLVLRYISVKPLTENEICKYLQIVKSVYRKQIEKAFEEIIIHLFGVDGILWD